MYPDLVFLFFANIRNVNRARKQNLKNKDGIHFHDSDSFRLTCQSQGVSVKYHNLAGLSEPFIGD